jgi:DUF4097 and DUF4098 domain-containing protein YvlB
MAAAPRLAIATRSGHVRVVAEDRADVAVRGGALVEEPGGGLRVNAAPSGDVEVRCPIGTSVVVGTASGRVELDGALADVSVTTRSGRITLEHAANADLRTMSGRVDVGTCDGSCRVVAASGSVRVERAHEIDVTTKSGRVDADRVTRATVVSASGSVELATGEQPVVQVRSHSGSVEIALPRGTHPAAQLASRSGRVENECPSGDDGHIDVSTTSGRVSVRPR